MAIVNGLTVNDTLTIASDSSFTDLNFSQTQTVDGTGTIVLGGTSTFNRFFVTGTDAVLTIADDLTVTGNGDVFGSSSGSMIDLKGNLTPGPAPTDVINASDLTNSDGTLAIGWTTPSEFGVPINHPAHARASQALAPRTRGNGVSKRTSCVDEGSRPL